MGWAFLYMFVILKIPVAAAIYLVWWAAKEPEQSGDGEGGGSDRDHPLDPRHPRPPRRGPHSEWPSRAPGRVRAGATLPERAHGR